MPNLDTTIATAAQTRALEAASVAAGVSWAALMERAGRGVADEVLRRLERIGRPVEDARILVLIGPGNNGGDGLVVARLLHDAGAKAALYIWKRAERADDHPWRECRVRAIPELQGSRDDEQRSLRQAAQRADVVIDALLGIGVDRPLEPLAANIVQAINAVRAARTHERPLIMAIDVPTGINADSGAIMGTALSADVTVATGVRKYGHVLEPGATLAGDVVCAPIGLSLPKEIPMAESLSTQAMRALLPARLADSNKGTFGKVMIIAGAGRYPGAAFLTASGALRSGVGLVTLACGRSIFGALASALHETTFLPLPEADWGVLGVDAVKEIEENRAGYAALVVGPGIGREDETKTFLERLLRIETPATTTGVGFLRATPTAHDRKAAGSGIGFGARRATPTTDAAETAEAKPETETELPPIVVDADGLYLLASIDEWWTKVHPATLVLTPHPGEMARLLKLEHPAEVNSDRVGAAQRAAQEWGQIVVLKGAETVIAAPDGKTSIGPAGNPALATAGTGDVLAGVIGGLIAQGLEPFDAARLGVFLHAQAGQLVRRDVGEAGAIAGDLLQRLPRAITELRGEK